MKKGLVAVVVVIVLLACGGAVMSEEAKKSGEALFKQHCAACHPDGKNIINTKKTLNKKDLETNKVTSVDDIVKLMRNPGPGMIKFDDKVITEKDAREIAGYVLKTFNK